MTYPASQYRGFTLIEVLVALALMAMIATILIASLEIGGHTWQRVTRAAANEEDIARAQEFLRGHLSAIPLVDRLASDITTPGPLESDGRSIEFSSGAPGFAADGLWRYQVGLSTETQTLEVRSRRDGSRLPDGADATWTTETLLPHVESLAIQFWLKPDDVPGRWVDRWTDPASLPHLIRVDVTFTPTDHRRWPTLYVEPKIDTPATCEFDVVSRRCRRGA